MGTFDQLLSGPTANIGTARRDMDCSMQMHTIGAKGAIREAKCGQGEYEDGEQAANRVHGDFSFATHVRG